MMAPSDVKKMSCEEFQAQLPELISSGDDVHAHPHMQTCEICPKLIADLEAIRDAARELFPIEDPPDELWNRLDKAIQDDEDKDDEDKDK